MNSLTRTCPRCTHPFAPPHPRSREARCPACVEREAQLQRATLSAPPTTAAWSRIVSVVDGETRELRLANGSVVAVDWSQLYTVARRACVADVPLDELDACVTGSVLSALRMAEP